MDMRAKSLAVLAMAIASWSTSPPIARSSAGQATGLVGHTTTRVETVTYEPGTTRRWDGGEGLHQVTVVGGSLSVDTADGARRLYRSGDAYVAGWDSYTATSATASPVRVLVAHLRPQAE